jgi:hypothetical protein
VTVGDDGRVLDAEGVRLLQDARLKQEEARRRQQQADQAHAEAAEAWARLEEHLPPVKPPAACGPGRPPVVPTPAQVTEVLRLKAANPRLGSRRIGELVGLPYRRVQEISASEVASQNPRSASQKNPGHG